MNRCLVNRIVIFIVLFSHLSLFLLDLLQWETFSPKKPLVVHTYVCKPPTEKLYCMSKCAEKGKKKIAHKASPLNKVPSKITQRKRFPVTRSPTQKKSPPTTQKKQQLLKEWAGALAELERSRKTVKPSLLPSPPSIDTLCIDHAKGEQAAKESYFSILTFALKEALELPELGMVKLELTLMATGQVRAVRILEAESEKNARYLKRQLMVTQLFPFTEELQGQKKCTFVLTFCNEK